MQVAKMKKKRKRKNHHSNMNRRNASAAKTNDPLHSYDTSTVPDDFGDVAGEDGFFGEENPDNNDPNDGGAESGSGTKRPKVAEEKKMYMSTQDRTGQSTSGRKAWKEKHKKGTFSRKYQKKGKTETAW